MASKRKLWTTKYDFAGAGFHSHESRAALDRWVDRQVGMWKQGSLRSRHLNVYVDNREGLGRQLYERIDLAELATADST